MSQQKVPLQRLVTALLAVLVAGSLMLFGWARFAQQRINGESQIDSLIIFSIGAGILIRGFYKARMREQAEAGKIATKESMPEDWHAANEKNASVLIMRARSILEKRGSKNEALQNLEEAKNLKGLQKRRLVEIEKLSKRVRTSMNDTLSITVPQSTKWHPPQAEQLISNLLTLNIPITFQIVATGSGITWQIQALSNHINIIKRAVLSFYPQADIDQVEEPTQPRGSKIQLRPITKFPLPLNYALDLKSLDPLTGVVGAMTNLYEGEQITYSLSINTSPTNYNEVGRKLMKGGTNWVGLGLGLLTVAAAASSKKKTVYLSPPPPRQRDKREEYLIGLCNEKLDQVLRPAEFNIWIAASQHRDQLRKGIFSATTVFNREANELTTGGDEPLILTPSEIAALWHLPTEHIQAPDVVWSSGISAPLPRVLQRETGDTLIGTNRFQGDTHKVFINDFDRVTHVALFGRTRVGKTTLMHNMIHASIAKGHGVAVIDPHGDLIDDILKSSIPDHRQQDVIVMDMTDPENETPLNFLQVPPNLSEHVAVSMTMTILEKMFEGQWSPRMKNTLHAALSALAYNPGASIRDVQKIYTDPDYRAKALSKLPRDHIAHDWWELFERRSQSDQINRTDPITDRLREFYMNPALERMVTKPTCIDLRQIMDSGQIFLSSLAGNEAKAELPTLGALLITRLQMAAMSRVDIPREKRRPFYFYVDEVQNFTTASSLPVIYSEAAKYGLSLTTANQYLSQLAGDTLSAIMGNVGTQIIFRSGDDDARTLGRYVDPFDSKTLAGLDRFQTIVRMQDDGQTLPPFVMMTPPPPEKPDDAQDTADHIRELSRERFKPKDSDVTTAVIHEPEPQPELDELDAFDFGSPDDWDWNE